jgi:hypothetical protein
MYILGKGIAFSLQDTIPFLWYFARNLPNWTLNNNYCSTIPEKYEVPEKIFTDINIKPANI